MKTHSASAQRPWDWSLWRLWVWQSIFLGSALALLMLPVRLALPSHEGAIGIGLAMLLAWRVPTLMHNLSASSRYQKWLQGLTIVALGTALLGLAVAVVSIVLNSPHFWILLARLVGMLLTPVLFGLAVGAISILGVAMIRLAEALIQRLAWQGPLRPVHLSLLALPLTFGTAVTTNAVSNAAVPIPESAYLALTILEAVSCSALGGLVVARYKIL